MYLVESMFNCTVLCAVCIPCLVSLCRSEWGPVVMERVAMEFNKLQYNASKIDSHPLIDECNEVGLHSA